MKARLIRFFKGFCFTENQNKQMTAKRTIVNKTNKCLQKQLYKEKEKKKEKENEMKGNEKEKKRQHRRLFNISTFVLKMIGDQGALSYKQTTDR